MNQDRAGCQKQKQRLITVVCRFSFITLFGHSLAYIFGPRILRTGFAAVENVASIARSSLFITAEVGRIEVLSLRFIGATLLHSLSSALVGYYWGLAMLQKHKFSLLILEGLGVAIILHAVFNYLIVLFGPSSPLALLLLITTSFFIFNDFEQLKTNDEKL